MKTSLLSRNRLTKICIGEDLYDFDNTTNEVDSNSLLSGYLEFKYLTLYLNSLIDRNRNLEKIIPTSNLLNSLNKISERWRPISLQKE